MASVQPPSLHIHLLGGFRIYSGDQTIPPELFRLRKARSLIKLLALAPSHRLHRDQVIEYLWPESDLTTAANSFYQVTYAARRVLATHGLPAQAILQLNEEFLGLCPDQPPWVDVDAFETAAARAHISQDSSAFQAALDLYTGDLLPEDPYEDWATSRREALRQEHQSLQLGLAASLEKLQEYSSAIDHLKQALFIDPTFEEAHAGLMRLYARSGQRSAALAQYETCRQALEKELGVSPGSATESLYRQITTGKLSAPTPQTPATPPGLAYPTRLPNFLIPFVGRRGLLASIRERLSDPACRLLTLTGPGGTGKTRLAVEAVSSLSVDFPDSIFYISLAGLISPDAIVPAIAQSLGFTFFDSIEPELQLLDYLQNKTLLLLLDNFEHLLEGAEVVTRILEATSGVKVLATSRARLNLLYETLLPIPGMKIPPEGSVAPQEALQFSGVRLFLEGARRILPDYELSEQDLDPILDICRLVQGMPLGILLAAGWLEMLTPGEIATEIRKDLNFLASSWQDLPERQRSLRGVFDHSWRLLNEHERQTFAALSTFRGGFSVDAARKVAIASLTSLASLVGKSLVQRSPEGRFEIHELLRQYAAEKLAAHPGTEVAVRDHHSSYYSEFLIERKIRLQIRNEPAALEEVAREIDNILRAWDWAIERGMVEELDRCRISLSRFFIIRGRFFEGKALFEDTIRRLRDFLTVRSQEQDRNTLLLAIAHLDLILANFCLNLHLIQQAEEIILSNLPIFQEMGDREAEASCWRELGHLFPIDNPETGFLKALSIYEELEDIFAKAGTLVNLSEGLISQGKDLSRAKHHLQEALEILREVDSPYLLAWALYHLGNIYSLEVQYPEAEKSYLEGISILQKLGGAFSIAVGYWMGGRNCFRQGSVAQGKRWMREAIKLCLDSGNYPIAAAMLLSLLFFCWKLGDNAIITPLIEELQSILLRTHPPRRFIFEGGCEAYLGVFAWSQQNFPQARSHFRLALQKFRLVGNDSLIAYCLMPVAQFLAQSKRAELALELVEHFTLPAKGWMTGINEARETITQLEPFLPPELDIVARARGPILDFDSVVDEAIAAWKEDE